MSDNDIHGIEQGWTVKSVDGQSVGTVEETTDRYILVKSGLISAAHRYLPAVALAHVRPELSEVGISLSSQEIEEGDWSEPPAHGPRRQGAPLNLDAEQEAEALTREPAAGGPDKPSEEVSRRA
jgi:hypothetical protein